MHITSFLSVAVFAASGFAWSTPHRGNSHSWKPHAWQLQGWRHKPVVKTTEGVVRGFKVEIPGSSQTAYNFLGVPFASPPKRFSPPQPAKKHHKSIDATTLPPSCIQQFNYPEVVRDFTINVFATPPPPSESEDCLYLNVYTPTCRPPRGGFPVLFWIYGGALQFGYSGVPAYDGSYFAAVQDVIVVTINYRTNVFGFPNAKGLELDKQNLGFLDQRMALEWTSKNIRAFGGNPSKVTIFGESAGGYSVKQLVSAPPKPLTFRAAILESQATTGGNGTASWEALVAALNCTTDDDLACARAAPATTLKSIIEHQALAFPPVSDNVTQSVSVRDAITSGAAAQVPIIIGSNGNDGSVFALQFGSLSNFVNTAFIAAGAPQVYVDQILAQYPDSLFPTDLDKIGAIITDVTFQCPAAAIAKLTAARGIDAYRYIFNASFPNTQPLGIYAGAWHSSEIPEVFGTYNRTGATAQQVSLSKYMNTAWANFAKDPSKRPAADWVALGRATGDVQTFQTNATASGTSGPALPVSVADARCAIFAPVLQIQGL